jgi:hypothetical protein
LKLKVPSNVHIKSIPQETSAIKRREIMSKAKLPVGKLKSSPTSSGVKFLKAALPSIRRRRMPSDKEKLEIYNLEKNSDFNVWDAIPSSPITPPAAFLPPGYRRSGKKRFSSFTSEWH